MKMRLFTTSTLAILILPMMVFANHGGGHDGDPCTTADGLCYSLESPLNSNIGSIGDLLTTILNVLLIIAVPIIVFFIIFAGFKYVTAQGKPEEIKNATRMLTYAIIGGVIILGAVAISEIIAGVVESFSR